MIPMRIMNLFQASFAGKQALTHKETNMPRPFDLSLEFFPPKSLEASFTLWSAVEMLQALDPEFVSITYGAGGSTRDLTTAAVGVLHKQYGLNVAGHLTCVDASRDEVMGVARAYAAKGASRIVALRGDPPKGAGHFVPHADGFASSLELIAALATLPKTEILVAAHPNSHPEAVSGHADIQWLKRKIDAGASGAITQFFFEVEDFLRFRDTCAAAGIDAPIAPGILPVENFENAARFAERCGTSVPQMLRDAFANAEAQGCADLMATAQATELCSELMAEGVDHLHFYTLNKPELSREVSHALGLAPEPQLLKVA